MSELDTWVTFPDGTKIAMSWRDDPGRMQVVQSRLEHAHGLRQRPHCDCLHGGKSLGLVVVRRSFKTSNATHVRYHLARLPQEGARHRQSCFFHSPDHDCSGAAGYVQGVIEERKDGTIFLRLDRSLNIAQKAELARGPPPPIGTRTRAGTATRRAMMPLGLLHLLWERSGLTQWHPGFAGKREMWRVAYRLREAAQDVLCGQIPLHEQLAIVVPGSRHGASEFMETVTASINSRYIVVVSGIHAIYQEDGRIAVTGGKAPFNLFLNCSTEQLTDLSRRFPYSARLLKMEAKDRPAQVMGLFVARARVVDWRGSPAVRADVELAALMEVTRDYLPVASALEQIVADHLVKEHRHFHKPLRYDADLDLVFPDFVLLDTARPGGVPMEVFGRDDEDYRERRAEKERYYRDTYGVDGWWRWIAAGPDRETLPSFPEKASRARCSRQSS